MMELHQTHVSDPRLARFISEDPIGGLSLYVYVNNNPVNFTDPSGLTPVTNNSNKPIPYKPETCTATDAADLPCPTQLCMPGQTCDVDGIYPPDCNSNPIKIVDGCSGQITPDGRLIITCPWGFRAAAQNGPMIGGILNLVRMVLPNTRDPGGPVSDDFMRRHHNWSPPNQSPRCRTTCNSSGGGGM